MAKVKVLKESELIGGTDNSSVYPITHTKAVFNSNNKDLDQILNELEQQITSSTAAQDRALAEAVSQERTERTSADVPNSKKKLTRSVRSKGFDNANALTIPIYIWKTSSLPIF